MKCDSRAHSWLALLQALALVASPRLRLWQYLCVKLGPREKRSRTNQKKKSVMVNNEKEWIVLNPIWHWMKKRSPSSGQNDQLVHWCLLVHCGPQVVVCYCCAYLELPSIDSNLLFSVDVLPTGEIKIQKWSDLRRFQSLEVREKKNCQISIFDF